MNKEAIKKKVDGVLVSDWRNGWKWISTWILALLVFLTTVPLPPEVLEVMPEPIRLKVLSTLAIIGFIMRFVAQCKPKE